jgi:hypothetical protein
MLRRFAIVAVAGVMMLGATRLQAQDKAARDNMIQQAQQAYDDFQSGRAMQLLNAALDPGQGPFDEEWAAGVHLLAQIHLDDGRTNEARAWLRWARRLFPDMPIDETLFLPETITASLQARDYVRNQFEPADLVDVTWQWSVGTPDPSGQGRLRIESDGLPAGAAVQAAGRRLPFGESVPLPIESYTIEVTAPGQSATRVTREVLPGITTVVAFNLGGAPVAAVPTLPPDVARSAGQQLVKLQVMRFGGAPECRVGFVSGRTHVVTTYDAIEGADSVTARFGDGSTMTRGIRVAAYDTDRNLAVLKLPATRPDSLAPGTAPVPDDYVWALTYPSCAAGAAVTTTQAQVRRTGTPLRLTESPQGANLGGAVITDDGSVVGVTLSGENVIPTDALAAVMAAARRNDPAGVVALADVARQEGLAPAAAPPPTTPPAREEITQREKKGGFPIVIVLVGVAAAGGAAAFLLAGGGGDPPDPPGETCADGTPLPCTGTITISVPDQSRRAPTSLFKLFQR